MARVVVTVSSSPSDVSFAYVGYPENLETGQNLGISLGDALSADGNEIFLGRLNIPRFGSFPLVIRLAATSTENPFDFINDDFSSEMESSGTITITSSNGDTVTIVGISDPSEPYSWVPSNISELTTFGDTLAALTDRSLTIVFDDQEGINLGADLAGGTATGNVGLVVVTNVRLEASLLGGVASGNAGLDVVDNVILSALLDGGLASGRVSLEVVNQGDVYISSNMEGGSSSGGVGLEVIANPSLSSLLLGGPASGGALLGVTLNPSLVADLVGGVLSGRAGLNVNNPAFDIFDFVSTGRHIDCLALISPDGTTTLYQQGSTTTSLDEGELGIGIGNTFITRVRILSDGANLSLNDNDLPAPLVMSEYFNNNGPGTDLSITFQTEAQVVTFTVEDSFNNAGSNFVNFTVPVEHRSFLNSLQNESSFIFALHRVQVNPELRGLLFGGDASGGAFLRIVNNPGLAAALSGGEATGGAQLYAAVIVSVGANLSGGTASGGAHVKLTTSTRLSSILAGGSASGGARLRVRGRNDEPEPEEGDKLFVKVILNNQDVTVYANPETWELDEYEGSTISTLSMELRDSPETRDLAGVGEDELLEVIEWSDIVLEGYYGTSYDSAVTGNSKRLFAGMVSEVATTPDDDSLGIVVTLNCLDWKALLDRNFFSSHFYRITDKQIISRAFSLSGLDEIDFGTLVQETEEVLSLSFQGASLRQMMNSVTEQTGYIWDIDKHKRLIHEPEVEGKDVEKAFSDDPEGDTYPFYDFLKTDSSSQFNEVELHGSNRLQDIHDQVYSGNGHRTMFKLSIDNTLPQYAYPRIVRGLESSEDDIPSVDVYSPSIQNWYPLTVGIQGNDNVDVQWNPALAIVTFSEAPPKLDEAWRISGRTLSPITLRRSDKALQRKVGHIFRKILTLPEVDTQEEAERVVNAFLREQAAFNRIAFTHDEEGVGIGDIVEVTHSRYKLVMERYTVYQNVMRHLGNQNYQYRVTANLAEDDNA